MSATTNLKQRRDTDRLVELVSQARSFARRTFLLLGVLANTGRDNCHWDSTPVVASYPADYRISLITQILDASDISAILRSAILPLVSACVVDRGRWTVPASQPALDR
jgi:hypothetical protein